MGGSGTCAGVRSQLGVYLTGSILPADRAVVVRHLASCAICRAELADLSALPGLLRRPASQAAAEGPGQDPPGPGAGAGPGAGPGAGEVQLSRLLRSIQRRRRRRRWLLALAAAVLVAVAGTGWALRLAQPPGSGTETMANVLEIDQVDGVTVLTDAEGYTLYWFGPDNPTMSACDARCIRTWPPVAAPAVRGAGVTGALGAIARPDGSLQATYDGHPLYTATADTEPGQAKGNGVWDGGGQWHEVVVGGAEVSVRKSSPSPLSPGRVPARVRAFVFARPAAHLADERAERVAEELAAVVRAAAPQPPRGLAHGPGRPRGARFSRRRRWPPPSGRRRSASVASKSPRPRSVWRAVEYSSATAGPGQTVRKTLSVTKYSCRLKRFDAGSARVTRNMKRGDRHQELCAVRREVQPAP
jgi:predicted lipoprotein with Yx(FWY)xxD motif